MKRNNREKRGTDCLIILVRPVKIAQVLGHSQEGVGRKKGETRTVGGKVPSQRRGKIYRMGTKWDMWVVTQGQ